ncbi:TPR-like protein [Lentinula boryana]|uniref:TPR-like protein n=1 Tax=Lentinula boryana TaxID=40481 RepID=A0ABQ8QNR9_9AGAR|nr:TPR-like protein [Lentinula boryana]
MSSSIVKTNLKNARDLLGKKNYAGAKDAALQVLQYEADNYNANVFLGLASLELGELSQGEQAYKRATELNPDQLLAWQGLSQFYVRTKDWEKYADVLRRLVDMHAKSNDAVKCAETLQKYIDLRRERGTSAQLIDALYFLLPDSPLYEVLSNLPPPDSTNPTSTTTFPIQTALYNSLTVVEELIVILERDEESYLKREFEKRRTRLNAGPPEQIRKEIGQEVWGNSRLPSLYNQVLNHPNTEDTLRRQTESKLLRYKQQYMISLPASGDMMTMKEEVIKEIEDLISGMVLLHIPDELAWMLFLDKKDVENIDGYDYALLQEFIALFPSHPLTGLLKGYFIYKQIPISDDAEDLDTAPQDMDVGYDMILVNSISFPTLLMLSEPYVKEAFASVSTSLIATRIVCEVHLVETDYENAVQVAESGLRILAKFEQENGKKSYNVRLGFQAILATSLVHLYPPKHHSKALQLITEILAVSPQNVAGIMGKGYILEASNKWEEAAQNFAQVFELLGEGHDEGLRAKEEHAWCISRAGDVHGGTDSLENVLQILNGLEGRDHDRARCYWRLGKCLWNLDSEKTLEGYQNFVAALKCDPNYAPAFTSLGIYYSEHVSPPDPARASKCFQKAFELDPREADAAHRLAKGFADEQEWDLVEVVARRTIEGEGGLDEGLQKVEENVAGKYLPTNTWAWKALGVVDLMNRNYAPAINALQVALRAEPDDSLTWLRLGEAYFKSGRHSAALKALGRSQELHDESNWICSFFTAEVYRQTGQFENAIEQLGTVLSSKPAEVSVLTALARTYLDLGRAQFSDGFVARAEHSFLESIRLSLRAITDSTGFRTVIWKTVADALYFLSTKDTFCNRNALYPVLVDIKNLLGSPSSRIADIIAQQLQGHSRLDTTETLELAIATYDHRVNLGSSENVAVGSAWFDLSVALRALAKKIPDGDKKANVTTQSHKALIEAIRTSPTNDSYWVALGDTHFVEQPKMAQHAYIKALEIDSKNVGTWTNLGLLFYHHNDLELANEAFYRAQSADPDYTLAWFGQALIAITSGHLSGATSILEHAVGLTNIVPEVDFQYALRVFFRRKGKGKYQAFSSTTDDLLPVFFILDRHAKSQPNDPTALHLYALVCESLGQLELGIELITRAVALLEASYEQTEDTEIERQFTIAHSNIGRLKLSLTDYEGALESFETSLGLLSEENDETVMLLRVQGQIGSGIAHFKMGNLESALDFIESAVGSAADHELVRGEATVMLAQTLWALGTSESKEQAKTLLLDCISADPENLIAINTLAAMGILTDDESLIDAALSEILALPLDRKHALDPQRDVDHLLIQHHLRQDDAEKALSVAQSAVFTSPGEHKTRNQMATLLCQMQRHGPIVSVLSGPSTENLLENKTSLKLQAVAEAFSTDSKADRTRAVHLAQKNVMLRPSDLDNWHVLTIANASAK